MPEYKVCNSCGVMHTDFRSPTCTACRKPDSQLRRTRRAKRAPTPERTARDAVYRTAKWRAVRQLALQRDGYACLGCSSTQQLAVHHHVEVTTGVDPYDLDNLETLCRVCHGRLHAARRARTHRSSP